MEIVDCRVCVERILAYEFSIVFMELSAGILKMNVGTNVHKRINFTKRKQNPAALSWNLAH